MADSPPWDKKKRSPLLDDSDGPQSTVFVGAPSRPKQDESAVLLVETSPI